MTPKMISKSARTSGNKTTEDWKRLRELLKKDFQNQALWNEAYNDFFLERIESRFIEPVKLIKDNRNSRMGAGFTMVAILCILMEHLEAFYEGVIYTTGNPGLYQYKSSRDLFLRFLTTHEPFKSEFGKKDADRFYNDVRCGLLHEAATKKDALIHKKLAGAEDTILHKGAEAFVIYRNALLESLEKYVNIYKEELNSNELLKRNFFRKLDELNGVERVHYFAYGSNMSPKQMENERGVFVHSWRVSKLCDYKLTFNKKSKEGINTYANIEADKDETVWGVLYEIDKDDFDRLHSVYEKGYNRKELTVTVDKFPSTAITFMSNSTATANPSQVYLNKIIKGALEKKLPTKWIEYLSSVKMK